jgi:hypothetical protein
LSRFGPVHPFTIGINRLAAARWLLAAGDTTEAMSLLHLHELDLPQSVHPVQTASFILGNFALPALARIEQARRRPDIARHLRETFELRVDHAGDLDRWLARPFARVSAGNSVTTSAEVGRPRLRLGWLDRYLGPVSNRSRQ